VADAVNGNGNNAKLAQAVDGAFVKWIRAGLQIVGIPVILLGLQRGCDKIDGIQSALNDVAKNQDKVAQQNDVQEKHLTQIDGQVAELDRSDQQQTTSIQVDEAKFHNLDLDVQTFICRHAPLECKRQP
jgi:hypothetical protein